MSNPGQDQQFRCFPLPDSAETVESPWLTRWLAEHPESDWDLPDHQAEAMAQLIPLLLCGEQSAALIFHRESNRLSDDLGRQCGLAFATIEADERVHDSALQRVAGHLPRVPGQTRTKRRAQLFYARLGSNHNSLPQLFTGIQHLDACVCQIMHAVATSEIGKNHPFTRLFEQIKRDEARHVMISKKHAKALGSDAKMSLETGRSTRNRLVELLSPQAHQLEVLGVDAGQLFSAIKREKLSYG